MSSAPRHPNRHSARSDNNWQTIPSCTGRAATFAAARRSHRRRSSRRPCCGSTCRRRPSDSRSPAPRRSAPRQAATVPTRPHPRRRKCRPCQARRLCASRQRENAWPRPRQWRSAQKLHRQSRAPCREPQSDRHRGKIAGELLRTDQAWRRRPSCCAPMPAVNDTAGDGADGASSGGRVTDRVDKPDSCGKSRDSRRLRSAYILRPNSIRSPIPRRPPPVFVTAHQGASPMICAWLDGASKQTIAASAAIGSAIRIMNTTLVRRDRVGSSSPPLIEL